MVLIDESWQSALLFKYLLRENQQVGMRTFSVLVGRLWIWNDLLSISFFYSDAGKKVSRSQQQQVAVKLKTCPGCGRSFRWNFSRHRSECHALAAKRRFSCPTCPSTFTRNATLRYHLEHVHGLPFHRWRAGPAILQRGGIYPRRTEMCVSEGFTRLNDRPRSSSLSYAASLSRDPIFPPQTFFFFFSFFLISTRPGPAPADVCWHWRCTVLFCVRSRECCLFVHFLCCVSRGRTEIHVG